MRPFAIFALMVFSSTALAQPLSKAEMQELEQYFRTFSGNTVGDFTSVVYTSITPVYACVKTIKGRRQFVLIFYDPVFGFKDDSFSTDVIAQVPIAFLDVYMDGKLDWHQTLYTPATQKFRNKVKPTYYQEYYEYTVRSLLTFFRMKLRKA